MSKDLKLTPEEIVAHKAFALAMKITANVLGGDVEGIEERVLDSLEGIARGTELAFDSGAELAKQFPTMDRAEIERELQTSRQQSQRIAHLVLSAFMKIAGVR